MGEAFAVLAAFRGAAFKGVFRVESIFGADGCAGSFGTFAVRVASGLGVSAESAEAVEAGADGAVAAGAASGLAICGGGGAATGAGGAGVNEGAADSKPKEAGRGASTPASPRTGGEPSVAGAVRASGRVSKAPACKSAAGPPCCISRRASLEGATVSSFRGLASPSFATAESWRGGGFGASCMSAKLAQIINAPANASPPAVSFQLRERSVVDW